MPRRQDGSSSSRSSGGDSSRSNRSRGDSSRSNRSSTRGTTSISRSGEPKLGKNQRGIQEVLAGGGKRTESPEEPQPTTYEQLVRDKIDANIDKNLGKKPELKAEKQTNGKWKAYIYYGTLANRAYEAEGDDEEHAYKAVLAKMESHTGAALRHTLNTLVRT